MSGPSAADYIDIPTCHHSAEGAVPPPPPPPDTADMMEAAANAAAAAASSRRNSMTDGAASWTDSGAAPSVNPAWTSDAQSSSRLVAFRLFGTYAPSGGGGGGGGLDSPTRGSYHSPTESSRAVSLSGGLGTTRMPALAAASVSQVSLSCGIGDAAATGATALDPDAVTLRLFVFNETVQACIRVGRRANGGGATVRSVRNSLVGYVGDGSGGGVSAEPSFTSPACPMSPTRMAAGAALTASVTALVGPALATAAAASRAATLTDASAALAAVSMAGGGGGGGGGGGATSLEAGEELPVLLACGEGHTVCLCGESWWVHCHARCSLLVLL